MSRRGGRLDYEEWVLSALLGTMTLIVVVNVLSRYVLHQSLAFTEDLAVDLFVWVVFLAAGLSVVRDVHVGFSVFVDLLPERWRDVLAAAGRALFLSLFAVLAGFGALMVRDEYLHGQRSPVTGWPEWLFGAAVPVGATVALLRICGDLVRRVQRRRP
ncbi:MAG: TRAP transporter small permease [Clostridia bacterium]|nr:TRAP transporter small permease [Clostridia bacterium]